MLLLLLLPPLLLSFDGAEMNRRGARANEEREWGWTDRVLSRKKKEKRWLIIGMNEWDRKCNDISAFGGRELKRVQRWG